MSLDLAERIGLSIFTSTEQVELETSLKINGVYKLLFQTKLDKSHDVYINFLELLVNKIKHYHRNATQVLESQKAIVFDQLQKDGVFTGLFFSSGDVDYVITYEMLFFLKSFLPIIMKRYDIPMIVLSNRAQTRPICCKMTCVTTINKKHFQMSLQVTNYVTSGCKNYMKYLLLNPTYKTPETELFHSLKDKFTTILPNVYEIITKVSNWDKKGRLELGKLVYVDNKKINQVMDEFLKIFLPNYCDSMNKSLSTCYRDCKVDVNWIITHKECSVYLKKKN
jgi:hypothetical protein